MLAPHPERHIPTHAAVICYRLIAHFGVQLEGERYGLAFVRIGAAEAVRLVRRAGGPGGVLARTRRDGSPYQTTYTRYGFPPVRGSPRRLALPDNLHSSWISSGRATRPRGAVALPSGLIWFDSV